MKTLILADVHLKVSDSGAKTRTEFTRFLENIDPSEFERIILLGDLFDFWFEYKQVLFSGYFEVLSALHGLSKAGVKLDLVCGNHDFWAGRFLRDHLDISIHPDKFTDPAEKESAQEDFTNLNTAHDILRDPKRRLQHLLTLERGKKPAEVHDILPETADLFIEVGQLLKPVDTFLAEREKQSSTLLKAQSYAVALNWLEKVNTLQQTIAHHLQQLDTQAKALNSNWNYASIENLFHQYSYLQKWQAQLNDRAVRLGL